VELGLPKKKNPGLGPQELGMCGKNHAPRCHHPKGFSGNAEKLQKGRKSGNLFYWREGEALKIKAVTVLGGAIKEGVEKGMRRGAGKKKEQHSVQKKKTWESQTPTDKVHRMHQG